MIYELRTYEPVERHAEALRRRFEEEVVPRFARHGIELLGVFTTPAADGRLTYLTRYPNEASRQRASAAFGADPEWKAAKAASEVDGPLLHSQTATVLEPILSHLPLA